MGAWITALLSEWKLPTAAGELVRPLVAGGHGEALGVVAEVLELEAAERKERRTNRLRRASKLPPGKTFDTLDKTRVSQSALLRVQELSRGDFVDHAGNLLLFGMPGVSKSHLACALVDAGRSVLFTPTYQLVQQLLAARRDLSLPRALRALDVFDAILHVLPPTSSTCRGSSACSKRRSRSTPRCGSGIRAARYPPVEGGDLEMRIFNELGVEDRRRCRSERRQNALLFNQLGYRETGRGIYRLGEEHVFHAGDARLNQDKSALDPQQQRPPALPQRLLSQRPRLFVR
ncbi:ATP-binding protein [Sorangium cellulosum]|nr:ATP-binding protein [Sorangium cellulosum]